MKMSVTTLGCDAGKSGIGRYAVTLLDHWLNTGVSARVFGHASERSVFDPQHLATDWQNVAELWKSPVAGVAWHQLVLPQVTRDTDVLFLPAGNRRLPLHHTVPSVATVHDCSSLHIHGKYDRKRDFYIKQVLPRLMQRLDHVITVSESTRVDIVNHCGVASEKVSVIPLAADRAVFFPRDREECRAHIARTYAVCKPFLLYISRIEHPGKGHVPLIRAFEQLKQRHRIPHELVIVGKDCERAREVHEAAEASPARDSIRFLGAVPGRDLPVFYNAAELFVLPSLFEGFGLPLVEAMACGTPTACSNLSSLPEVAAGCAAMFDPYDDASIAAAMLHLLDEPAADRSERIARGLARAAEMSWERTSWETLEVITAVAKGVRVRQPAPVVAAAVQQSWKKSA